MLGENLGERTKKLSFSIQGIATLQECIDSMTRNLTEIMDLQNKIIVELRDFYGHKEAIPTILDAYMSEVSEIKK